MFLQSEQLVSLFFRTILIRRVQFLVNWFLIKKSVLTFLCVKIVGYRRANETSPQVWIKIDINKTTVKKSLFPSQLYYLRTHKQTVSPQFSAMNIEYYYIPPRELYRRRVSVVGARVQLSIIAALNALFLLLHFRRRRPSIVLCTLTSEDRCVMVPQKENLRKHGLGREN